MIQLNEACSRDELRARHDRHMRFDLETDTEEYAGLFDRPVSEVLADRHLSQTLAELPHELFASAHRKLCLALTVNSRPHERTEPTYLLLENCPCYSKDDIKRRLLDGENDVDGHVMGGVDGDVIICLKSPSGEYVCGQCSEGYCAHLGGLEEIRDNFYAAIESGRREDPPTDPQAGLDPECCQ